MEGKESVAVSTIACYRVSPAYSGSTAYEQRTSRDTGAIGERIPVNLSGAHASASPGAAGAVGLDVMIVNCAISDYKTASRITIGKRKVIACCGGECVVFEEEGIC